MLVTQLDGEAIGKIIGRCAKRCLASSGKLLLVMHTRDGDHFLPLIDEGLVVHQDSVEFVDLTDGAMKLLFSHIERIRVDNLDDWQFPSGKFQVEPGKNNLAPFRKPRQN